MYRTVAQLDNLTGLLAQFFPQLCTRVQLPEPSVEGRPVFALRLRAGGGGSRRGVLLVGGTHARELMNPDLLVELAIHLIVSYQTGNDVVLGNRTWTAQDIAIMLEALDIYLLPCGNPDGRNMVMTVDDMWRKNRRDNPGTACDGVDLNRNLDLLWGVTEGQTSCSPCSDVYAGSAALSEPETRNVRHLLDTQRIDCFVDVHSYSELVLYPWGHAPTQTTDSTKRFTSLPSGTCQPLADPNYEEYMDPRDLLRFQTVAQRIVDAIRDVRGRSYTPQAGIALYPTTGTHSDYVYGRHIADPAKRKTYGFTIEAGPYVGNPRDSFHPADPEPIKRETESGLLALVQQCICAIELIGSRILGREDEVDALRRVRDEVLGTTAAGRQWIALFERVQTPFLTVVLADERMAAEIGALMTAAGELLADDRRTLDRDLLDRTLRVLRALDERAPTETERGGLRTVQARLESFEGRPASQIIDTLLARGPDDGYENR
ncbi:MAG: M14 family zinc carboxypeptidase [Jiangellaceae bacterium]